VSSPPTPQEMAERALARSTSDGCIVITDQTTTANLRWANNTLTTNGVTHTRQLTVIATVAGAAGTSVGVVARGGMALDSLESLVAAADQAARDAPPAEDAQPLVGPEAAPASVAGWEADPIETTMAVFSALAPSLGDAFEQARGGDRLLFGFAQHQLQCTYLASSTGLRLHHNQPTGYVELNAKSNDYTRSAWAGLTTRDFTGVDLVALDHQLAERLRWAEHRTELPAGRYETLLPPTAVADLMVDLYWSAGARDAQQGRSVFSQPGGGTRVGELVTNVPVTLRSDPGQVGLECQPFVIARSSGSTQSVFDNGLPLQPTNWIDGGRLGALVQTRHSAPLTALPVTPGIDNLIMEASAPTAAAAPGASLDDMIAGTDRGLLLTCLWYIRVVDPQTLLLTGLTRDGVYLIEHGEVVGAVNNFRFNESPVDLLGRITEVGATEPTLPREWADYFTRAAMPALRIPDFNMSSVSQAT